MVSLVTGICHARAGRVMNIPRIADLRRSVLSELRVNKGQIYTHCHTHGPEVQQAAYPSRLHLP
jgi:hypothetical protein